MALTITEEIKELKRKIILLGLNLCDMCNMCDIDNESGSEFEEEFVSREVMKKATAALVEARTKKKGGDDDEETTKKRNRR